MPITIQHSSSHVHIKTQWQCEELHTCDGFHLSKDDLICDAFLLLFPRLSDADDHTEIVLLSVSYLLANELTAQEAMKHVLCVLLVLRNSVLYICR